jgi:nucleoside triphosphate pyrophosphatase
MSLLRHRRSNIGTVRRTLPLVSIASSASFHTDIHMSVLILASASEARARMLARARISFEVAHAHVDEESIRATLRAEGTAPRDVADALAEAKAAKISSRHPSALVIGADQVLDLDGEVIAKADTQDELREQLSRLSGRTHKLHSACVAAEQGRPIWRHVGEARLHVRTLSPDWLDGYLDRNWEHVRGSVGGYLVEDEGIRLFDRVDGDIFTVLGMPLVPLLSWLTIRGSIPG